MSSVFPLALRLGYAPQDETLRQAILTQFPDLVLGASGTSDPSKVTNLGLEATIGMIIEKGTGRVFVVNGDTGLYKTPMSWGRTQTVMKRS